MEKFLYQCQYCGKEYKPNRRHKQIFCSNSCRTNSHIRNKKLKSSISSENSNEIVKPNQIEKMSWAGVGNAAAGTVIAQGLITMAKKIVTNDDDKPATKKDIAILSKAIKKERYYPIDNIPLRLDGAKAFFDMETLTYLYLFEPKKIPANNNKPNTFI